MTGTATGLCAGQLNIKSGRQSVSLLRMTSQLVTVIRPQYGKRFGDVYCPPKHPIPFIFAIVIKFANEFNELFSSIRNKAAEKATALATKLNLTA